MPAKERMLAQGKAVTTAVTTAQTVTAGKRPPRCDQRWAKGVFPPLRERWVLLKIPRCDIDGVGEVK